ncbi:hypothetical protein J3R30DRAFT_3704163 [Lentinula aciculospora]|uniref:Uncharacterized protein n=1 Tax=Lentinula aciculospora TaxID=153920 RepID=A0A9W9DMH9_9AGAR|nr:hypothetical protein J3R30DRAFT_3704163 [Lentinula aciculospora]
MSSLYNDKSQILTPPPSLREILTAYRSKGDGDRDMLIAMLNAKTSEDRRIAETSALHRTIIDTFTRDISSPTLPPLAYPHSPQHSYHPRLSTLSTGLSHHERELRSSKSRSSRSPPRHTYSPYNRPVSRDSATPPVQMPPSPYSSASNPDSNSSPKLKDRGTMPLASMLSNENKRVPELQSSSDNGRLPNRR